MRIRMHQGVLSDSLTTVSVLQDWEDFVEYCKKYNINIKSVRCKHYSGQDERIGWSDTWVIFAWFNGVMCERELPLAFSEGDVMKLERRNKMKLVEITVQEWNELNFNSDHYFANGCVFEESTDNLVAFSYYEDAYHEAGKYYKVVKE